MKLLRGVVIWPVAWLLLVAACSSPASSTVVTATRAAGPADGQPPNLDQLYTETLAMVRARLPRAYFQYMVFSGDCQGLPLQKGRIVFNFVQADDSWLYHQVQSATATVDTVEQTLQVVYADETEHARALTAGEFVGQAAFTRLVTLAGQAIGRLGIPDCQATLTQTEAGWRVRCGPLENFVQACSFLISADEILVAP